MGIPVLLAGSVAAYGQTVRAYAIATDAIAAEKDSAGNTDDMDITNVDRTSTSSSCATSVPSDVRFKVLAVSAEHNINHAALADTINIAEARGGKIYPGNSALGEVLEVGANVTNFKPGDIVITHCNGEPDEYGFPLRIWAYDQPESIGWYSEEAVVGDWQLIKAPLDCGLNLWEMAALPLRAPTAYHLWRRAIGIYRVKVPVEASGHDQRARLRRRRVRAVPAARQGRGAQRVLLLRFARAARRARDAGHRRHRPEAVQPLRRQGRHQGVPQAREPAHRRRRHARRVRHAARPRLRRRSRRVGAHGRERVAPAGSCRRSSPTTRR